LSQPAIQSIGEHMKQKTNTENSKFSDKNHEKVNNHGPISMQKMKLNTASVRVENGVGKKMVQIDQHR